MSGGVEKANSLRELRLQLVGCCIIGGAGVLPWRGAERMQRDASENNVKSESMHCFTEYPGEERKGKAMGFSVLRLGDQKG